MRLDNTLRQISRLEPGAAINNVQPLQDSCSDCYRRAYCLARGLNQLQLQQYGNLVKHSRRFPVGTHLYRMEDPFKSVFTVLSGCVKIYRLDNQGDEHLIGFRLPGELVGVDAIGSDRYPNSTIALETTFVCEIPYQRISECTQIQSNIQAEMIVQLGRMLRQEQCHGLCLAGSGAEQRVASFLIDIGKRLNRIHSDSCQIELAMSRGDIANYLGLAIETVSRTLTFFKDRGLISVRRKNIKILSVRGLARYAKNSQDSNGEITTLNLQGRRSNIQPINKLRI